MLRMKRWPWVIVAVAGLLAVILLATGRSIGSFHDRHHGGVDTATVDFDTMVVQGTDTAVLTTTTSVDSALSPPRDTTALSPAIDTPTAMPQQDTSVPRDTLLTNIRERLLRATIAYTPPDTMRVGRLERLELAIIPGTVSRPAAESTVAGGAFPATVDTTRLSSRMVADLVGDDFDITRLGPRVRNVTKTEPGQWRWNVKPTRGGKHVLNLIVSALVPMAGTTDTIPVTTFDRDIHVQVDHVSGVWMFVKANWQWLWAAVVVPLAGAVWGWLRTRRIRQKPGRRSKKQKSG